MKKMKIFWIKKYCEVLFYLISVMRLPSPGMLEQKRSQIFSVEELARERNSKKTQETMIVMLYQMFSLLRKLICCSTSTKLYIIIRISYIMYYDDTFFMWSAIKKMPKNRNQYTKL
jgi:hypothetical protein